MPPYQNDSLHDMHALMQQLDTLNAAHAPDHLEMYNPFKGSDKTTPAPAPTPDDQKDSKSMLSRMTGGLLGGKKTTAPASAPVAETPVDPEALQQSLCEIAAKVKDWHTSTIQSIDKMIRDNPQANEHYPAKQHWTVPHPTEIKVTN